MVSQNTQVSRLTVRSAIHVSVLAVLLLFGCEGTIGESTANPAGSRSPTGGTGTPTGTGTTGTGTTGTGTTGTGTTGAGGSGGTGTTGTGGASGTGGTMDACGQTGAMLRVGQTRLRRMTRSQFNNTVRDLLGASGTPASAIAPDERIGPFYSNAIAPITNLITQQHAEIASKLAIEAQARMGTLSPCNLVADTGDTCATQFITQFGRRAYRRPLVAEEIQKYLTLFTLGRQNPDAQNGFRLVVEAMLQSPFFLYHADAGSAGVSVTPSPVSPYELASRMSYFFWDTMPDEDLFKAAAEGRLQEPTALADQVARMLADPRARDSIPSFHLQWLEVDEIEEVVTKDATRFPAFNAEMLAAMRAETVNFVDHVVRQGDGLLKTLFTANFSFPDGPLSNSTERPSLPVLRRALE